MRYAIIGTGAIGGYYGSQLVKAGKDVHFLLNSDYEYVRQHGLQIDSCRGSYHLDGINAYHSAMDMPKCDIVIVALKSTNNHLLASILPPLLHPKTLVLLIQNGIGVEADLQSQFPNLYIAAGLAFICSGKIGKGHIDHQSNGSINIGNYSCKDPKIINNMMQDFTSSDIKTTLVEYEEARWKKAVWNMPYNGLTVALNTTTDQLMANPKTAHLIKAMMMEVIGAAQAQGVANIDESFADKMIAMTLKMPPYSPSMKLDYDHHRPMEIHYLYTRPIEEAHKAGYKMPKLEMLEAELMFIEEREKR